MNTRLFLAFLFVSSRTAAEPLVPEPKCPGINCDLLRAIAMKIIITFFDFNCMYTNYLGNLTECLCGPLDSCVGTRYNECLRQEISDTVACKDCSYVNMHIANTQEADFNCFPSTELLDYRDCVCEEPLDECPGTKHNRCFRDVFWMF